MNEDDPIADGPPQDMDEVITCAQCGNQWTPRDDRFQWSCSVVWNAMMLGEETLSFDRNLPVDEQWVVDWCDLTCMGEWVVARVNEQRTTDNAS